MKIWGYGELMKMVGLKKLSLRPGYHCAREPGHRQVAGFDDPINILGGPTGARTRQALHHAEKLWAKLSLTSICAGYDSYVTEIVITSWECRNPVI